MDGLGLEAYVLPYFRADHSCKSAGDSTMPCRFQRRSLLQGRDYKKLAQKLQLTEAGLGLKYASGYLRMHEAQPRAAHRGVICTRPSRKWGVGELRWPGCQGSEQRRTSLPGRSHEKQGLRRSVIACVVGVCLARPGTAPRRRARRAAPPAPH